MLLHVLDAWVRCLHVSILTFLEILLVRPCMVEDIGVIYGVCGRISRSH